MGRVVLANITLEWQTSFCLQFFRGTFSADVRESTTGFCIAFEDDIISVERQIF
ncbi:uncharacterized protein PHALS_12313 [Plasmopara halstedii]|uniref:Uncharacterized protein n=1 Tax=Plasmopara halstedii TaxID=4781 RepID=A0A0P1AMP3_PLAHL|nr:uncharacterized protein PHALS_12313 [Plasmopara halstedii]CEG42006.1 hypothetical protein PHALS_12313 [Plasmopara halstedii]|eukprot:XP_024578375.1 hypothetical protein PHALS_12313 [Plasmopara halstedii]